MILVTTLTITLSIAAVAGTRHYRARQYRTRRRPISAPKHPSSRRPHVVIVGGGFAGLQAARALRRSPGGVTLIDRANHNLFQPLLYQVATAMLSPADVAVPIAAVLRRQGNTAVVLGDVTGISVAERIVELDNGRKRVPYDFLIVAAGARQSYVGRQEWEHRAPGLKTLDDALEIRRRFLLALECAKQRDAPPARQPGHTIVIVGGGSTGVELAGMTAEFVARAFAGKLRAGATLRIRVILVEAGPRLLAAFDPLLSGRAKDDLERMGVEVRTDSQVTGLSDDAVLVGDERIPATTVVWAAGNKASPLGQQLGAPLDRSGRVQVAADLSLPDHPEVFVVGDLAAATSGGEPVPAVATAAKQMGRAAAKNVLASIARRPRAPFVYSDKGSLAVIGRRKAVVQIGGLRYAGPGSFVLWAIVHLMVLGSFNRAGVLAKWMYAGVTAEVVSD